MKRELLTSPHRFDKCHPRTQTLEEGTGLTHILETAPVAENPSSTLRLVQLPLRALTKDDNVSK